MRRRSLRIDARAAQRGVSLIEAVIAAALLSVVATAVATVAANGIRGVGHARKRQDLEALRRTVLDSLDCQRTLDTPPGAFPKSCLAFPAVSLRRLDGAELAPGGKIGGWDVAAGCDPACVNADGSSCANELIVRVSHVGVDPLTGKPWSDYKTATDLFGGTSDLCYNLFTQPRRRTLFGGQLLRCPFKMSTGATQNVAFADMGDVVDYFNPFTGTDACPDGYTPTYTWGFTDYGCGPTLPEYNTRYYVTQCGWKNGVRWSTATDAPQGACPNCWRGCSLAVFTCTKDVWE
jgi:hypothetical protein